MFFKVPTIEEIYNEYHKQKFYFTNGVYPKTIKNFNNILDDKKKEYLLRFQHMISKNREWVDWKLYIYACASLLKNRFELKILGTLPGNKLYRTYITYNYNTEKEAQEIYDEIIRSLQFLIMYFKENNLDFNKYFLENIGTIPLALKHLYSGTISIYFYSAFNPSYLYSLFSNYQEDVFHDLFDMSKNELIENIILPKRNNMIKYEKIREICDKLEKKFN